MNNTKLMVIVLEAGKSKIKVQADSVTAESSQIDGAFYVTLLGGISFIKD